MNLLLLLEQYETSINFVSKYFHVLSHKSTFFVIRDCTIMKSASTAETIPAEYDNNSNENMERLY